MRGPYCTCLYPSVASSSDSMMSVSHKADVRLAPGSDYCCEFPSSQLRQFVWGGLGLIIMSNLNLSQVKLLLGWVVTIIYCFVLGFSENLVYFVKPTFLHCPMWFITKNNIQVPDVLIFVSIQGIHFMFDKNPFFSFSTCPTHHTHFNFKEMRKVITEKFG